MHRICFLIFSQSLSPKRLLAAHPLTCSALHAPTSSNNKTPIHAFALQIQPGRNPQETNVDPSRQMIYTNPAKLPPSDNNRQSKTHCELVLLWGNEHKSARTCVKSFDVIPMSRRSDPGHPEASHTSLSHKQNGKKFSVRSKFQGSIIATCAVRPQQ